MTRKILDLLYPPRCVVCDRVLPYGESGICRICEEHHLPERIREPLCKCCGKAVYDERQEFCYDCTHRKHAFEQGRAVFAYRGMEGAMHRFKEENRRVYADFFASELETVIRKMLPVWRPQLIVPIPIHPRKKRMRGYNQAELLIKHLSKRLEIPEGTDGLVRKRETPEQKGLDREARRKNLRNAFEVKYPDVFKGKRILLVDDIYTTGSTIDAAAVILKKGGASEVFFAAVCIGKGD